MQINVNVVHVELTWKTLSHEGGACERDEAQLKFRPFANCLLNVFADHSITEKYFVKKFMLICS